MSVVCRGGALNYLFLISFSSDAQPGLEICGLEDLSFLTVIQLSIVVSGWCTSRLCYCCHDKPSELQNNLGSLEMVTLLECNLGSYCDQSGFDNHIAALGYPYWFYC